MTACVRAGPEDRGWVQTSGRNIPSPHSHTRTRARARAGVHVRVCVGIQNLGQRRMDHMERSVDVDVKHVIPIGYRELGNCPCRDVDPSIVDLGNSS